MPGIKTAGVTVHGLRLHRDRDVLSQPPPGALSLQFHHMAEEAVLLHQFRRGSLLCHPSVRENNDLIRSFHGAHPVGDD